MRLCGECTECCTGTLTGEVQGHKFDVTDPCFFLEDGKCNIYANRPDDPCKNYSCMWINNEEIPDFMRPDLSNVVLTQLNINGIYYIEAREAARKSMTTSILSNVIMYAFHTNQNLVYHVSGQFYWIGEPKFMVEMNKKSKEIILKEI
jgi:uncharacterized cysteine cluster protein YcgN (CxxCxxCC family)